MPPKIEKIVNSRMDQLFNSLVRRAGINMNAGNLPAAEMMLKLAFKAQSQARSSAEALNEINPHHPATFVNTANVAENRQINHGEPRVGENKIQQSKLLEVIDGQRLDARTQSAASGTDSELETVGAIDRAENSPGQTDIES
jgi:hypothetical protein